MNEGTTPDREIAHFIAAIVAARQTSLAEIPQIIASLSETVERLRAGPVEAPAAAKPAAKAARRRKPVAAAAASPPRRGRGRPRLTEKRVEEWVRRPEPVAVTPVAPRLMRRAEVAPSEPFAFQAPAPQKTVLRGVVRWFDLRTRQGTLRLPGFAEDIAIETSALESAGISRLYKGQEVEATVAGENGSARLVSLALPGRVAEPAKGLFPSGSVRRHAKPVVVEMKRDAMRRTAARVEAELVLGNNGRGRSV